MAKISFLKEGEPSQKKFHVPYATFRRKFKIALIISGVLNVLFIISGIVIYYNIHKQ